LPKSWHPFVKRTITLQGTRVTLVTHSGDAVLGRWLRAERQVDKSFLAELEVIKQILVPRIKVLDIGANIGVISVVISKMEPTSKIYCFEPDPLNYSLLNLNIILNHIENVIPINLAAGSEPGLIKMYLSNTNYGDHRSVKPDRFDLGENEFRESPFPISKVNPTEFMSQMDSELIPSSFDFIKIDTQGPDFDILEACIPLHSKGTKVTIEYSPYHMDTAGTSSEDISRILGNYERIQKINPLDKKPLLENISIEELLSYFESTRSSYSGYFDLLLTY